jgi:peptidoglycan/LPS O-acetylase OafA/YrhL
MTLRLANYRPDIDGLRAIAVLAVVFYHANIWPFSGGFVGVDVFFVISGYLITSLIQDDCRTGQFSIVEFYERRVRRIFPALFVIVAICFVVGGLLMMPLDYKQFGYSAVANALFASNVLFWLRTGYFDADAEVKPLLHTWSLAVEEQFYIFFPFLLFLLYRYWRNRVASAVLLLLIGSLLLSVWQVYHSPDAAFYLPLGRAWELMAGALLALSVSRLPHRANLDALVGVLGITLILGSIFLLTAETPFPGLAALPACLGAAAVIYSGSQSKRIVTRLLSMRVAVFVGLVSYSLYLWHWPLIVFAKYFAARPLTSMETVLVLALSLAAATASYRYVERPFRQRRIAGTRPKLALFAVSGPCVAIAFGLVLYQSNGLPQRLPADAATLAMGAMNTSLGRSDCHSRSSAEILSNKVCVEGDTGSKIPTAAVLGDSFAIAVMPGIEASAKRNGEKVAILTRGGCYPLLGIVHKNDPCPGFMESSLAYIKSHPSIKRVILVGRWTSAVEGTRFGTKMVANWFITDDESPEKGYLENARVFARALRRTIKAIEPVEIFVVEGLPEQRFDIPRVAALNAYLGRKRDVNLSREDFDDRQMETRKILSTLADEVRFSLIDVSPYLCDASQCAATKDGQSLYSDDNHLNNDGALQITKAFDVVFKKEPIMVTSCCADYASSPKEGSALGKFNGKPGSVIAIPN